MGTVIDLAARRQARDHRGAGRPGRGPPARFSFDVTSPFTYLAAERVERAFPGAQWRAVVPPQPRWGAEDRRAERRAEALRMPLVWPDARLGDGRRAHRVAAHAAERGCAPAFVIAAGRLAYCGGFDLDDPSVLAEAAVAAGLALAPALAAAEDRRHDQGLGAAATRLRAAGAVELPVVEVGAAVFAGEERLAEAAAVAGAG
jgi:2-hydroxychromene-2-carboxylate isomerase